MKPNSLSEELSSLTTLTENFYLLLSRLQVDSKSDLIMKKRLLYFIATACDSLLEASSIIETVDSDSESGLIYMPETNTMERVP